MTSFVGIFVSKSFAFSVSEMTFLQSLFLIEGNVVFFSDMILLMISTLICSSWVNVFVCVLAMYRSLSCSVWLGVFGFPVFSVSVTVLGVYWCVCQYIYWWISRISRPDNQPFFLIVLTWPASLRFVVLNLTNSVQISIILFLYILFVGLLLKQQYDACLLSSLLYFLCRGLWFEWSICSSFVYLEKEQLAFTGYRQVPHFGYQGSICRSWHPNLSSGSHGELCFHLSFFMGYILWLYQTQGLFIICTPDTDTTEDSYGKCICTTGHTKLSFKFVQVQSQAILYFSAYNKYLKEYQVFLYHLLGFIFTAVIFLISFLLSLILSELRLGSLLIL